MSDNNGHEQRAMITMDDVCKGIEETEKHCLFMEWSEELGQQG